MFQHKTLIIALTAVFVVFCPVVLAGETLESIEKKISEKWDKVESMSAKMTITTKMGGEGMKAESKGQGTFEYISKDGKELQRHEMKVTVSYGEGMTMESSTLMISDGVFLYTLAETMGQKSAAKTKLEDSNFSGSSGKARFQQLRKESNLKLLADEKIGGKDAWVIEASVKTATPGAPSTMKFYFLKDTGMMTKMVVVDSAGATVMTLSFTDVKINVKIDPSRFVFKAPAGVQVIDMTGK